MGKETPATPRTTDEQVLLLIVNGVPLTEIDRYCRSEGQSAKQAVATVRRARRRITIVADYARDEHLAKAVLRLEDLYGRAHRAKDWRTALQAQREMNRLLDLYAGVPTAADAGGDDDARRLVLIASYLKPLGLTDGDYPVEEHARLAAERIRAGQ